MKPIWVPRLMIAVACLHLTFGLLILPAGLDGPNPLPAMLDEGLFNSLHGDPAREALAWFNIAGLAWLMQAHLVYWILKHTGRIPYLVGGWLIGTAVPMLFFMPASGFWLALVVGVFALFAARRTAEAAP